MRCRPPLFPASRRAARPGRLGQLHDLRRPGRGSLLPAANRKGWSGTRGCEVPTDMDSIEDPRTPSAELARAQGAGRRTTSPDRARARRRASSWPSRRTRRSSSNPGTSVRAESRRRRLFPSRERVQNEVAGIREQPHEQLHERGRLLRLVAGPGIAALVDDEDAVRAAAVPAAPARSVTGDDRFVPDPGAVPAVLGLAVGFHPQASPLVDGAGGLERRPPLHRGLDLAKDQDPAPRQSTMWWADSVLSASVMGRKRQRLDLELATGPRHQALARVRLRLVGWVRDHDADRSCVERSQTRETVTDVEIPTASRLRAGGRRTRARGSRHPDRKGGPAVPFVTLPSPTGGTRRVVWAGHEMAAVGLPELY